MKGWVLVKKIEKSADFESASCLQFHADIPIPNPADNEIMVEVRASGLNPVDYKVAAFGMLDVSY